MEFRDEITPQMQENWFRKIENDNNFYYIIWIDNKEIGLINIRDINYETGEGEPGIFIWDDDYINTPVSIQAVLALTDFGFDELNLKKMVIHVLSDNKRAIKFNLVFGYTLSPNQEQVYNKEYILYPEAYNKKRKQLLKLLNYGN